MELEENLWDLFEARVGIYNKYLNLFLELEEKLWDWFEVWISFYTLSISGTGLKQGLASIPYYPGARAESLGLVWSKDWHLYLIILELEKNLWV